ncbi:hypothetical protein, partial [Enterobacter hormaechei]
VRFQTKSAGMHPASWLRRAEGDAGAMMLDAYRQILSETEPAARAVMLEFLESVRIHYVSS